MHVIPACRPECFRDSEGFWTSQNDRKSLRIADFDVSSVERQAAMTETGKVVVLLMNSLIIGHQGESVKSYIDEPLAKVLNCHPEPVEG